MAKQAETVPAEIHWWGSYEMPEGRISYWQIGSSKLYVTRYPQEWRVAVLSGTDFWANTLVLNQAVSADTISPDAEVSRFAFRATPPSLTLAPALADRPIVVKPEDPLFVQAGEEVTLFVSVSLWISLEVGVGEPLKPLLAIPATRPSDTWFGKSTIEGELCYASRSLARLRLQDVTSLPHRVITPVRVRNKAGEPLLVERIRLPVQFLSLYRSAANQFWTQQLTLVREQAGDMAEVQVSRSAPTEAGKSERVKEARQKVEKNLVMEAFSRLFRGD